MGNDIRYNIRTPDLRYDVRGAVVNIYGGTNDKSYTANFSSLSVVIVNHNLGKYPGVTVLDATDGEVLGYKVQHNSINQLTVTFNNENSGKIICN